eukprot:503020-Pleurochrysis_carterae.AAC.4
MTRYKEKFRQAACARLPEQAHPALERMVVTETGRSAAMAAEESGSTSNLALTSALVAVSARSRPAQRRDARDRRNSDRRSSMHGIEI